MATRPRNNLIARAPIGLAVLVAAPIFIFVIAFRAFYAPAASDEPNLYRGDYFFVLKAPFYATPRRGDLIAFKLPSADHVDMVKRLVGMPGDRIQLKDGRLLINGAATPRRLLGAGMGDLPGGWQPVQMQEETNPEGRKYKIQVSPSGAYAGDTGVYVVPPHCYFVLGDNRDNSLDSRFNPGLEPNDPKLGGCGWDSALDDKVGVQPGVGFVPERNLVGRAAVIVLSWNIGPDETHPGGASLFKPWTWFADARPSRFFKIIN